MPPPQDRQYYVYILTGRTGTLYVGVTNDLERRMYEHRGRLVPGFASKYGLTRLAYYEEVPPIDNREQDILAEPVGIFTQGAVQVLHSGFAPATPQETDRVRGTVQSRPEQICHPRIRYEVAPLTLLDVDHPG